MAKLHAGAIGEKCAIFLARLGSLFCNLKVGNRPSFRSLIFDLEGSLEHFFLLVLESIPLLH